MTAPISIPQPASTSSTSSAPRSPKLLDQLADVLRRQRYAPALVRDYVGWVRRYIYFHPIRHPAPRKGGKLRTRREAG